MHQLSGGVAMQLFISKKTYQQYEQMCHDARKFNWPKPTTTNALLTTKLTSKEQIAIEIGKDIPLIDKTNDYGSFFGSQRDPELKIYYVDLSLLFGFSPED